MSFSLILKLFFLLFLLILSILAFSVSHPIRIASILMFFCIFRRMVILKFSFSWVFYLLILIFLGGVIIIITYISSLAANEKIYSLNWPKAWLGAFFLPLLPLLDSDWGGKLLSSRRFTRTFFSSEAFLLVVFCFSLLLAAIISIVKLINLDEGPLTKRLLKSNLNKNICLSSIKYFSSGFNL